MGERAVIICCKCSLALKDVINLSTNFVYIRNGEALKGGISGLR